MKRIKNIIAAVLCLGFAVPAFAVSYTYPSVGDSISVSMGTGVGYVGEINVDIYSTVSNPDFITFCVEHAHDIYLGQNYTVLGISNATDAIPTGPSNLITPSTAYLYTMFTNNTLAGYSHTPDQAEALQNAIWFLQGQITGQESNTFVLLAESSGWSDIGNVRVINFGPTVQDLLTIQTPNVPDAPVPEPSTLVLLGLGLAGICCMGLKKRTPDTGWILSGIFRK